MHSEPSTLHRVKTRLARFSEKLRREGEEGGTIISDDGTIPSPPPRHLLRHILHRGATLPGEIRTAGERGGDSADSDSELLSFDSSGSSWHRSRHNVGRALSDTDGVLSGESEDEPSIINPASQKAPHLTALLLNASRLKYSSSVALNERSSSVAECSLEASLVPVLGIASLSPRIIEDGTNSAPEISACTADQTGLLEKLGQRIKQRSDRVHRVNFYVIFFNKNF
jgi:hypothetical protein